MKRLLFAVVSLCVCMHISAQEEYEAFAISEFAYSMSGDDSQCYAILKKDFMQTEEFVELFTAVMECYAEYGATQKTSPKAKAVMDKVKSYALGGRVFARVTPFQDGTFGVVDYPSLYLILKSFISMIVDYEFSIGLNPLPHADFIL